MWQSTQNCSGNIPLVSSIRSAIWKYFLRISCISILRLQNLNFKFLSQSILSFFYWYKPFNLDNYSENSWNKCWKRPKRKHWLKNAPDFNVIYFLFYWFFCKLLLFQMNNMVLFQLLCTNLSDTHSLLFFNLGSNL